MRISSSPAHSRPPFPTYASLNHSLFHRTTNIPLHVHPALWSTPHLDLLRVSVTRSPAPTPLTPSHCPYSAALIPQDILSDFFCAHELSTTPPFTDALHLLTNAFESLPGAFATDNTPLTLGIGTTSTTLTPYAFATRTSLQFAALTTPLQPVANRARYSHRRRSPATDRNPVHPSDIALLLALAQEQEAALPPRTSYMVHVLAPDETARWICGMSADVGLEYLLSLKEPWRDMRALDVRVWEVAINGLAEEVGAVVWALGESAVRVKRRRRGRGGGRIGDVGEGV